MGRLQNSGQNFLLLFERPNRPQGRFMKVQFNDSPPEFVCSCTYLSVWQAALRKCLVDQFLSLAGGKSLCDGAHRHLAVDRRRHPQTLPVLLKIRLGTHVVHFDVVGQPAKAMKPGLKYKRRGERGTRAKHMFVVPSPRIT